MEQPSPPHEKDLEEINTLNEELKKLIEQVKQLREESR